MGLMGIIGGTGLTQLEGLVIDGEEHVNTPYGEASVLLQFGQYGGQDIVFLARHGADHLLPPHKINYRANLWALADRGVSDLIAVNAVGGIANTFNEQALVVPHQVVDYTWGRESSYSEPGNVVHTDFTFPYTESLREILLSAAGRLALVIHPRGVHGVTQGPRLETAAEVDRLEKDGCDIVGMTGMPEACLARELELRYACLALVVNMAAGRSGKMIVMEDIERTIDTGMAKVRGLLENLLNNR